MMFSCISKFNCKGIDDMNSTLYWMCSDSKGADFILPELTTVSWL